MKYLYSLLFFFISFIIVAQEQPINSNPNKAIKFHLENLQDEQYIPEEAAKVIHPDIEENRKSLAVKLKHVLDGQGLYIDLDIVPKDNNYFDSLSNANRYYLARERFPDLYVEKVGEKWFYSKKTVSKIEEWHNETFPFGTDKLMELLPKNGHKKLIGLYIWQYVGIFLLIALTFILHKIFSFIIEKVFIRFINKLGFKHLA
ncbi:MAG: mechanosensitive ion channel family protein, partial [Cyclobacteriaceae bacterium]|nr:mechanosensitive ion channel family protein [Cyclobacteriaceae bacterium]